MQCNYVHLQFKKISTEYAWNSFTDELSSGSVWEWEKLVPKWNQVGSHIANLSNPIERITSLIILRPSMIHRVRYQSVPVAIRTSAANVKGGWSPKKFDISRLTSSS